MVGHGSRRPTTLPPALARDFLSLARGVAMVAMVAIDDLTRISRSRFSECSAQVRLEVFVGSYTAPVRAEPDR